MTSAGTIVRLAPAALSALLLAAHFLRSGEPGALAACLGAGLLLRSRRRAVLVAAPALLLAGAFVWAGAALDLVELRRAMGLPWQRLALILGGVAALTAASALPFLRRGLGERNRVAQGGAGVFAAAFLLTVLALGAVQSRTDPPLLLAERLWPGRGWGWPQVLALAVWAGWLAEKMVDPATQAAWRLKLWAVFGAVFFAQAGLSLAGFAAFSMTGTGELHVPVPAVILAGPLFRGEGLFMPALLAATVLLAGPAWCSHLCYFGAFDQLAASRRKRPGALPRFGTPLRVGLAATVVLAALGLRWLGAPGWLAATCGLGFGLAGVAVMLAWSRRTGTMIHCVLVCPIGLVVNLLSKLSPWRLRIADGCTGCGACAATCRTGALEPEDIERRRPGFTCTLCGDCVGACREGRITYRLGSLAGHRARATFIALVAALHAIFLALARA